MAKSSQTTSVLPFGLVAESTAQLMYAFRLPNLVKRALPPTALAVMYRTRTEMKKRLLSRGLSRTRVFEQAPEQKLAGASMSIVVAIHDAPDVTRRCLASLERYATRSQVILVDDGSVMAETTGLIQEFGDRNTWTIIRNAEAEGHSAACEAGARLASRPYLCLLNSDTVVTPWCWRAIEEAFDTDTAIGVAGPSTSASGNEQALEIAEFCRFHWNDSQISAFAERLKAAPPQPVILDLPWADGFAFFIRRNLWEELNGFDHNLPDYGNEIDLCKRVVNRGYRIVWVRSSYIHHLRHQSYANEIGDHEIQSRILAASQYISQRHN